MALLDTAGKVLHSLYPPENGGDPRHWRRSVFYGLVAALSISAFTFSDTRGWLGWLGITEIARADQVDTKINNALKPIQESIKTLDSRSISILRAIYLPEIRAKVRERCDNPGAAERAEINRELDRILGEYKDAAGERFSPMPRCEEV